MENSICNFVPYKNDYNSLHTINFVLERKLPKKFNSITSYSTYKISYVLKGSGTLHLADRKIELTEGDIFFNFPGVPYGIEGEDGFEYLYITFIGSKATMIIEDLGITKTNLIFHSCEEVLSFWEKGIDVNVEISDLMIESILLYTFYYLGSKLMTYKKTIDKSNLLSMQIKKYIDDNYSNKNLSLKMISTDLSYSPKYISTIFKKTFNISISKYLITLRTQHACNLINHGFTSISDISNQCGFSDSQYFSKVFKKEIGTSPKEYIKNPN